MRLIAKTLLGLEEPLAAELRGMGAADVTLLNRAVAFDGPRSLLYGVNYNSRLAVLVLMPVASFTVAGKRDLYNEAVAIEWDRWLDTRKTFAVTAVVNSPHFDHSGYVALVVKDAVADFFRRLTQERPSVDQKSPDLLINVHISNEKVTLSLDSTVTPLYRRGYRRGHSEAPLNEVLAAGMIALSGWKADKPLADGMCGSGTIPAEAGLIACNIAPGKFRRNFGFMRWKDYDAALFRSVKFEAEKRERRSPVIIYGSDISEEACRTATLNIREAGLADMVEIGRRDFMTSPAPAEEGTLIINPPYGRRIATDSITDFYGAAGSALKHGYSGYTAWILSGERGGFKSLGLKPFKKYDLLNGDIKCRFAGYELYSGSRKRTASAGD
ncbi:MAG: THUMP domain-containing protein [Bacteroidales bacterium]|nr:THUMP domain-containing protein [Bacteroidales bacterium]MDT8372737.1 THUMP domain-containing protein [Bacteroidales bacterium]